MIRMEKAPRRHRGMFKDTRGFWYVDYYTPDRKRRRKLAGKKKADADRLLRTLHTSIAAGEYVDASKVPGFTDYAATFMERYGNGKASLREGTSRIARLKAYFGTRKLSSITVADIENYRITRLGEPDKRDKKSKISRSTVDREITILRSMLSKAVKWGLLAKNPANAVEDYKADKKRTRFLTIEEIRGLKRATKRTHSAILRPAVILALETGMRKGELLGLRWQDINFEAGQILIRETKSGEDRRVPMSRRARWVLAKLAARDPLHEWVFQTEGRDGGPKRAGDIKTPWARALTLAQVEDLHFHDLRHTFASHFAMKGGNLYALAKILGHASPKMTLDTYAHLSPQFVNDQRRIMDAPAYRSEPAAVNARVLSREG